MGFPGLWKVSLPKALVLSHVAKTNTRRGVGISGSLENKDPPQVQSVPQKRGRHQHGTRSSTDLNCNPSHKKQVAIIMGYHLQRTSTAIRPTKNRSPSSWNTIFNGPQLQSSLKNQVAINMEHDVQRTSTAIRPTQNRPPSTWHTIFKGPQLQSVLQ